ncbi:MAG: transcriptional regulator, PadR-like protein family [uncultured bacterium]|uniref:Transcriptional regulator PadR family protein n=1 Tax=Candidatus Giovannonibacteria bacterium GW2011_GWA2_53_7 TaxID=1618650 RepID=A0A0G2A229_9BACT|nr:MAG: transcriptional regulator, PadR-like protein family [uncultured bacterium]KKW34897.1 MAG: Transcriptional regulator PadR family protein [Candidatus Giovannonibacteria bacterium GW2011_GWA2_53_7]HBY73069.1 PadR family transcriptional regulator [Candidatus Kerfeldbacteria bacterium]
MTKINKELLKGSSDILLLKILADKPLYGYEIAKQIKQLSDDVLAMGEGTLYPLLHRLEQAKLLESFWQDANGRKRKYYALTAQGKKILETKTAEWKAFTEAINSIVS